MFRFELCFMGNLVGEIEYDVFVGKVIVRVVCDMLNLFFVFLWLSDLKFKKFLRGIEFCGVMIRVFVV